MITEQAAAGVPAEIFSNVQNLRAEVDRLQQELNQASGVWKATMESEKAHFEELLLHKELAWREQEEQWARQSEAYAQRLDEMRSEFEARLKQAEQNASRALADLDETWQRDKLNWGPQAPPDNWQTEKSELEGKIATLERQLSEQKSDHSAEPVAPSPDAVKALQMVASAEERSAQSDELLNACLKALDYQITVLYDLVQYYSNPDLNAAPPSDLVQS